MNRPSFLAFAVVLWVVVSIGMPTSARAFEDPPAQDVIGLMSGKLVRGVANVGTGWVELPKQIVTTFQEDGALKGIVVGPLKGIGMTLVRTLAGVGEIVTFLVPAPGYYDPYLDPEYVWQKEKK